MFAIAVSLGLLGFVVAFFATTARNDGAKMLAALRGESWASQPAAIVRPVSVRFSQRYPASRPMRARPALRAAA
jgi:hypothetical protein